MRTRESLVLGSGLSWAWEEDEDPETRQVDHGPGQERAQETEQEENIEGRCTRVEQRQKSPH